MSFKTEKKADAHAEKVLAILGDKWTGNVWENLGWHVSWQWGSVTLYYSHYRQQYHSLIGEPNGCGGHMDLTQDGAGFSKDPQKAIRLACDYAIEVSQKEWLPIQSSVAQVRLVL